MKLQIPINYHTLSQNIQIISTFLKKIKVKNNTMLLFSKGCYEFIKQSSIPFGEIHSPVSAKKFAQLRNDIWSNDYFSFIPMYSGEWFYLETFHCDDINFDSISNLPQEIKFISLENEFPSLDVNLNIIKSTSDENPLDCIIHDYNKFKNSLIIISENVFSKLERCTNIISYHKGFYRLEYYCDNDYPGGIITLRSFNNAHYYLLENMGFHFFNKIFSVNELPNAIHFII